MNFTEVVVPAPFGGKATYCIIPFDAMPMVPRANGSVCEVLRASKVAFVLKGYEAAVLTPYLVREYRVVIKGVDFIHREYSNGRNQCVPYDPSGSQTAPLF